MMKFIQTLAFLRSLCLGGSIGVAIAIVLCLNFDQTQYIHQAIFSGGSIGAAMQRVIAGVFMPIVNFAEYYAKLLQIELLDRHGIIDKATCNEIKRQNTLSYLKVGNPDSNPVMGKILPSKSGA